MKNKKFKIENEAPASKNFPLSFFHFKLRLPAKAEAGIYSAKKINGNRGKMICPIANASFAPLENHISHRKMAYYQGKTMYDRREMTYNQGKMKYYHGKTMYNPGETKYDHRKMAYYHREMEYNRGRMKYYHGEMRYNRRKTKYYRSS